MNPGEITLGDDDVRLAPEADVGGLLGDEALRLIEERAALGFVHRCRRLVEKPVHAWIAEVAAVEAGRRHLSNTSA